MAYFTMGMWLYPDCPYPDLARLLAEGLLWAQDGVEPETAWGSVTDGALSRAREKLGPAPLRVLFEHSAAPAPAADGSWRGLRMVAIDVFRLDMPKTAANQAVFGDAAHGTLPSVQVTVLTDSGSRRLLDATMEPLPSGAWACPPRHPVLGPGTLLLGDCRPTDFDFLTGAAAAGAAVLCGAPAARELPAARRLPDGSHLASVPVTHGESLTVRVVHPGPGAAGDTLCTTLLEPSSAPVSELVRHHAGRHRVGQLIGTLRSSRGSSGPVLRSRLPWGVEQEVWAMLCTYQALSHVMPTAPA